MSADAVRQLDSGLTQPTAAESSPAVVSPPASRFGWFGPGRYLRPFGHNKDAAKQNACRWRKGLPEEQKRRRNDGTWEVAGDARLPGGAETVMQFCQRLGSMVVSAEAKRGSNRQRAKQLAAAMLVRKLGQPDAGDIKQALAELPAAHGLGSSRPTLGRYRKRLSKGELVDKRAGSSGRRRDETLFDPEIFGECVGLDLHGNKFKVTGGYSIYAYGQARAWKEGKVWKGSPATFARRLREATPEPIRRAGREGLWSAEAYCIPKVHRDRSEYAAGEVLSLDGRLADQYVRVPKGPGAGWKLIRPIDVVLFDFRSTKLVAWQCTQYESADATLAAYYRAVSEQGVPDRIETDNGKGFICALVSKRAWSAEEQQWLNTAATLLLGTEIYRAPARQAWHKLAESCNAQTKEADRQSPGFKGGSASERPEDVERWARQNLYDVPTFEEYRAQRERDYALYNSTPRPALNDLTPDLIYEQEVGAIRRVDDDVLQFVCARPGPKRRVGRDGVRFNNVVYGAHDEDVWRLQGHDVWLRIGPDASFVWLCDQGGKPLAIATQGRLSGATAEDLKRAERHKAHLRKITREYLKGREFLLGTKVTQVREVMREYRAAQQEELRRTLPEPPTPTVSIVGTGIAEPVKELKRARRRKETRRVLQAAAGPAGAEDSSGVLNPFDLLFTSFRDKDSEDVEETGCQADLLKDFGHAG